MLDSRLNRLTKAIKGIKKPLRFILDLEHKHSKEEIEAFEKDEDILYITWDNRETDSHKE